MQLRHKFLAGACASLLTLTLFGFGLFGSIYLVAGKSNSIKDALHDSGIYQTGVGDALDQSQKDNPGSGKETIPTDNPEVRNIIKQSFPPAYVQGQAEQALDALYAWLQGKTPSLALSIDLTEAKLRLADGMAAYVQNRVNTLPLCAPGAMPSGEVDAFNATCVPSGFNETEAVTKARDDILNGDFLKDAKFDANTVKSDSGKTLSQQLQPVPDAYRYVTFTVFTLGIAAVLLSAGVIFLGGNWRAGMRRLGIIMAVVGVFSVVLGWLSSFAVHRAAIELAKSEAGSQPLQQKIMQVVELLVNDLRTFMIGYGIILVVLGAAAITGWYFLRRPGGEAASLGSKAEPSGGSALGIAEAGSNSNTKPRPPEIKE